ncbi:MAG: carboxylating nicotinate-nucleotide diphosphorylase [Actinobacteria bacterium]|nr:carboxylating nicotinate-nucleotide diphosphorylase [Actinomycetota bacterium]
MIFYDLSSQTRERLISDGLTPEGIVSLVEAAILEDLDGGEDVTSLATIPADHRSCGEYVVRVAGIVAGIDVAVAVLEMLGLSEIEIFASDGDRVPKGFVALRVSGNTRQILLAERTSLNFLGHLSGIATLTRKWVDEIAEYKETKIRDTRKTTPGFRQLEKYAVRMGGAVNHRMSLRDAALIKDNHIAAAGGVAAAFANVRTSFPSIEIEVEVDNLNQLREIIPLNPDLVLLDNMSVEQCAAAVKLVAKRFPLEASGGLTIENARAYAQTGVTYLAVGALTHSAKVLDIGLDLKAEI